MIIFAADEMQENQLKNAIYLLALITGSLLLLSVINPFSIGNLRFKRINILADIHNTPPKQITQKDTVLQGEKKKVVVKLDSCPAGITCIEDYSDHHTALAKFFKALKESKSRAVRVAFFGDSFIEGDILCASLRDTLQGIFGGRGVGYVPITSQAAAFRTTIHHTFSGWKTYWAVGDKNPNAPLGLPGYCFVPEEENEVEYKPGSRRNNRFSQMRLFYVSSMPCSVSYTLNDTISFAEPLKISDTLQRSSFTVSGANVVKLKFKPVDSLRLYGTSFEDGAGLYIDNFAMRGNSGMGLFQVEPRDLHQFNRFQNYKLIILQYGLNVVTEDDTTGYDWYSEKMVRVINRLKEVFPESSILLTSVSDRAYNENGKFVTIPNILVMREAQRAAAQKTKIAFWDLFSAMGGENSIVKYAEAKPPLAGKDYTHLNFSGGRKLSKKLADALLYERSKLNAPKKAH